MIRTFERLSRLEGMTAVPNWDGERGKPIASGQWATARMIVSLVTEKLPHLPPAHVNPCGDGFVHLQWTGANGSIGLLEIGAESHWWSHFSPSGDSLIVELADPELVVSNLAELFGAAG